MTAARACGEVAANQQQRRGDLTSATKGSTKEFVCVASDHAVHALNLLELIGEAGR